MPRKILISILILGFLVFSSSLAAAKIKKGVNITAQVGNFYLNVSGYISPFASIVMSSNGVFMRSTTADSKGNFSLSQILVKDGFSNFCLDAIDFRRLGESYTCFNFPPIHTTTDKKNIFLPPTLGLSRTVISEGENVLAFGYTMPGAIATIHLSDGRVLSAVADASGYYEIQLKNVKAGTYDLFATAHYKQRESLNPSKKLQLKALSLAESFWNKILNFLRRIWMLLTSIAIGILWIVIPILILIFILLYKLWPERFTWLTKIIHFFIPFGRKREKEGPLSCPMWPYCYIWGHRHGGI